LSVAVGKKARRKAFALELKAGLDLSTGKTDTLLLVRGVISGRETTFSELAAEPGGSSSFSPASSPADPGKELLAGF
jgi:hypothetical protein